MTTHLSAAPPQRKRPRSVTFFALAVLYLSVVNLARAGVALNGALFARTLPLSLSLDYVVVNGLVWGIVFGMGAWGVWRLATWARRLLLIAIVVYQIHVWVNHWLFDTSTYARQVWPFHAGISLTWMAVVWLFLFLPGIRRLYRPR